MSNKWISWQDLDQIAVGQFSSGTLTGNFGCGINCKLSMTGTVYEGVDYPGIIKPW